MEETWKKIQSELKKELPPESYERAVRALRPLKGRENSLILEVQDAGLIPELREVCLAPIKTQLRRLIGKDVLVDFSVSRPAEGEDASSSEISRKTPGASAGDSSRTLASGSSPDGERLIPGLNPHHTFASFIRGDSNTLALKAAEAAVRNPGKVNPLYIHGESGLGKTHLLHAALRAVLGAHVEQRGSNISADRLRFDFSHGGALTSEERSAVEAWVQQAIDRDLPVYREVSTSEAAKARGATGLFDDRYDGEVSVYGIGDLSLEICAGPHVERTSELGRFRIVKEQSCGAGMRRIRALLSPT